MSASENKWPLPPKRLFVNPRMGKGVLSLLAKTSPGVYPSIEYIRKDYHDKELAAVRRTIKSEVLRKEYTNLRIEAGEMQLVIEQQDRDIAKLMKELETVKLQGHSP